MLDIPVRVKDALRDGRLLKNYKIKYIRDVVSPVYTLIGVVNSSGFTITETAEYLVGNGGLYNEFYLTVTIDGHTDSFFVDGEYEWTWETGTVLSTQSDQNIYKVSYAPTPTEFVFDSHKLIEESVKINEKLCSGDVLTFGLCEGSSIEFEYFDEIDLLGYEINVLLDIQYYDEDNELSWYNNIPMGHFTVTKCARQASTGIYKATGYNKIMSTYLDAKANDTISNLSPDTGNGKITLYTLLKESLKGYGINEKPKTGAHINVPTSTSGGVGGLFEGITFKLNGHNKTYYLSDLAHPADRALVPQQDLPRGKMVEIGDISEYIAILEETFLSIKGAVYREIQDPDAFFEAIKNHAFRNGVTVGYYGILPKEHYTLPELIDESQSDGRYKDIHNLSNAWNLNELGFEIFGRLYANATDESEQILLWENRLTLSNEMFEGNIAIIDKDDFGPAELIEIEPAALPDVTLRDLQSAVFETQCQYGQLDRQTDLFTGIELNKSALYPADTLYPAADLYPGGTRERTVKSGYSKLWSESGNVQSWRNLIITYKGRENNQEVEKTLTRTINANGTTDYNMSDNWLFKNLVWSDSDVGDYAAAMVLKMQDVTWFPFEMWGAGLPYLETGDQIEVVDNTGETYTSYVLSRQLDGIQNLQDTLMNGTLDIF